MNAVPSQIVARREWSPAVAVLLAMIVAGTLDITYAIVVSALRGVAPMVIWQSVASGVLGSASYEGGITTAVAGGLFHYGIMGVFAATYYLMSRRWPRLAQQPFIWGPLYGAGVFVVMNYVVVPLSAIGHPFERPLLKVLRELLAHLVLVGLPIAWFVSRAKARDARA